ncbi:P-loop containing nucleoside triphosphate hydrolase protein [Trichoderma ceciliae]
MAASGHKWRDISHSQFGDNTVINQGDVHFRLPQPAPAQVVRVVPYLLNEDLVYRRDLVEKLDRLLPQTQGFYSAALWGLGGSGKTQIALDLAYRRCDNGGCCVFWVHADSEATFTADYKMIGKKLGVDSRLEGPELLDAVRSSIEKRPRWVTIFDNADNLRLFGVGCTEGTSDDLSRYIPQGAQGTILWTSRDARIAGTLVDPRRGIQVPSMTRDEAKSLLATSRGNMSAAEEVATDHLLEELQRLPLAVSQAGAYMRQTSITTKEYLDLLMQGSSRWDLLKMDDFDRHRRPEVSNSVLETWKISIKRIQEENELSYRILHVIAYLDGQEIPHELMVAAGQDSVSDENGDGDGQITEPEVRQAVTRLVEFSFLHIRRAEEDGRSYEMHKLIQEALRYGLWAQGSTRTAPYETTAWESKPENKEPYYSSIALQIVDALFPESEKKTWILCEQYISHAIQVAEWAEVSGREAETSTLLSKVSTFLYHRGRWREKEPVDRRALNLRLKTLGEKHPETIRSMVNLGAAYYNQGQYGKAKDMSLKVLGLRREVLGEKHPDTIKTIADLGSIYYIERQYDTAKDMSFKVLGLRQEVLGERHLDTIKSIAFLGAIYHIQGQYDKAEEIAVKVLDLRRRVLGERHPDTIKSLADLGATYSIKGQYDKTKEISIRVLRLRQEVLGEKHPDTITSMAVLGAIYYTQGYHKTAEEISVKVLGLRQELLGENHPDTIKSMTDLAAVYYRQGQYGEAQRLREQALGLQQEVLGAKHPDIIKNMTDLGAIYFIQGQYDEAKRLKEQALSLQLEVLGEKHPDTIKSIGDLGAICHHQGQYDEAKRLKEQALGLRREVLGENHPDTIKSRSSLAATYQAQGLCYQ